MGILLIINSITLLPAATLHNLFEDAGLSRFSMAVDLTIFLYLTLPVMILQFILEQLVTVPARADRYRNSRLACMCSLLTWCIQLLSTMCFCVALSFSFFIASICFL